MAFSMTQNVLTETIFRHIPQYIFWKNQHSVYLGCNQKYAALLGLTSPQDIIGKTDFEIGWLSDGDTADTFRAGDQETLAGHSVTNQEESLSLPNGTKILTLISKVPLINAAEEIIGVLGVATDITEKRHMEIDLAKTKHQLQGMTILSASISHELRTPLAVIKGIATSILEFLPTLMAGYETAYEHQLIKTNLSLRRLTLFKKVVNNLPNAADQSNQIIDALMINLKALAHKKISTALCSARQCINRALSEYIFPNDKKPPITWEDHEDFNFQGQETLIVHVLFNLLKNAIYVIHKNQHGFIHIWIEKNDTNNSIHFKDTAIGIPPEHLPHIFEPFFTAGTHKGTGIGLAFCKTVMEACGGSIACQSVYHGYSEFILIFPK